MKNKKLAIYDKRTKKISVEVNEAYQKCVQSKKAIDELVHKKYAYEKEIGEISFMIDNLCVQGEYFDLVRHASYSAYLLEREVVLKNCISLVAEKKKIHDKELSIYQHKKIAYNRFLDKLLLIKSEIRHEKQKYEEKLLDELFITSYYSKATV